MVSYGVLFCNFKVWSMFSVVTVVLYIISYHIVNALKIPQFCTKPSEWITFTSDFQPKVTFFHNENIATYIRDMPTVLLQVILFTMEVTKAQKYAKIAELAAEILSNNYLNMIIMMKFDQHKNNKKHIWWQIQHDFHGNAVNLVRNALLS